MFKEITPQPIKYELYSYRDPKQRHLGGPTT